MRSLSFDCFFDVSLWVFVLAGGVEHAREPLLLLLPLLHLRQHGHLERFPP